MLLTIFMVKVSQTGCSAVAVTVGTTVLVLALKLMERQTLFVANNSVKLMAQKCKNYYYYVQSSDYGLLHWLRKLSWKWQEQILAE